MKLQRRLRADQCGAAAIETALIAPILAIMALGAFDTSRIIARQHELQNGAGDAEQIIMAAASGSATDTTTIQTVLANTLGIPTSNIDVAKYYRCGTTTTLQSTLCTTNSWQSTYVKVTFRDTYTPTWTSFGVGSPVNYTVVRQIQVSSERRP